MPLNYAPQKFLFYGFVLFFILSSRSAFGQFVKQVVIDEDSNVYVLGLNEQSRGETAIYLVTRFRPGEENGEVIFREYTDNVVVSFDVSRGQVVILFGGPDQQLLRDRVADRVLNLSEYNINGDHLVEIRTRKIQVEKISFFHLAGFGVALDQKNNAWVVGNLSNALLFWKFEQSPSIVADSVVLPFGSQNAVMHFQGVHSNSEGGISAAGFFVTRGQSPQASLFHIFRADIKIRNGSFRADVLIPDDPPAFRVEHGRKFIVQPALKPGCVFVSQSVPGIQKTHLARYCVESQEADRSFEANLQLGTDGNGLETQLPRIIREDATSGALTVVGAKHPEGDRLLVSTVSRSGKQLALRSLKRVFLSKPRFVDCLFEAGKWILDRI